MPYHASLCSYNWGKYAFLFSWLQMFGRNSRQLTDITNVVASTSTGETNDSNKRKKNDRFGTILDYWNCKF